jgi:ABC transport system ATP-binding/permease protein
VASKPVAKAVEPVKSKNEKLPWKEQRELESLPEKIAALEAEQVDLSKLLEDASIYQTNPPAAQKAAERLAAIDEDLLLLLERWEVLEAKAGGAA